jgi:serine phosphatase RsbU (regulator of sigma subunit)
MEAQIAVAKIKKYATRESGDTVEIIERPDGGISVVLVDGQSSGRGAKRVSNLVARKVVSLLAEGVRDGAAARAASDALFAEKSGRVSATLNILSIDMATRTLVVTRNNPAPTLIYTDRQLKVLAEECQPVGLYRNTRPFIFEIPLTSHLIACCYTDGLVHAGSRNGTPMQARELFLELTTNPDHTADIIAEGLLQHALDLDLRRPLDDVSVVVLRITPRVDEDGIRRLQVRLPLES